MFPEKDILLFSYSFGFSSSYLRPVIQMGYYLSARCLITLTGGQITKLIQRLPCPTLVWEADLAYSRLE
jgi:hypothetical protein